MAAFAALGGSNLLRAARPPGAPFLACLLREKWGFWLLRILALDDLAAEVKLPTLAAKSSARMGHPLLRRIAGKLNRGNTIPEARGETAMKRMSIPLLLLLSVSLFAADTGPNLKSAPMPFYPPLARQARIEGKVTLRFTVNEKGETAEIEATSGHKLLREAAIENLQSWKFWPPSCACRLKDEVTLVYKLSKALDPADPPTVIVRWFGQRMEGITVEIESIAPQWQP
jgi:TonB family protein